jgi:hypothetical protein
MTGLSDEAEGDRVLTHKESVRDLLNRFDDVMPSAAANGWDAGIVSQLQVMRDTARRFDEAMLADAATAVPDGAGLDTVLAGSLGVAAQIPEMRPELLTEPALRRIRDALKFINGDLDNYISNGDAVHLTNAFDSGLQNLYRVNGHCFGYWQLGNDLSRAGRIKHLSLRLGITDTGAPPRAHPVVKLQADGIEGLAVVRGRTFSGFPPDEILGPDTPLLPAEPARHVPLYVETSGGPIAGCIAALIHTWGDYIAWNDFRIFDSVYRPAMQPDPLDGSPFGMPQVFDREQYRAEVHRASTQRP